MSNIAQPIRMWEQWPSGHDATTWFGGAPISLSLADWGAKVSEFLGCGFRVRVSTGAGSGPLSFARTMAERAAQIFGTALDPTAWEAAALYEDPIEIQGGWEYRRPGDFSPPWTRIARGGHTHIEARITDAVRLPWLWNSDSPTAGLPMISHLEAAQAERHLVQVGVDLGLWFNHRDELCMSTAGPMLMQTGKRSWIYPDRSAGIVSNWAFFEIANRLGAMPAPITTAALEASLAVCSISELGNVYLIEALDDAPLSVDLDHVSDMMQVRRAILSDMQV